MTNSTILVPVPSSVLIFSVAFKLIAMVIGVLGNVTVIIYTMLLCKKEKTATSYLIANLALADLLVCLTFYPLWTIEFIQTILNIESDQELFCKLSRSTIWSLLFASEATILAITVDRYLYIVKPLKYPLIVTRRRVFLAISVIWLTACCVCVITYMYVQYQTLHNGMKSLCDTASNYYFLVRLVLYPLLTLIFLLNFRILCLSHKQRKRIFDESMGASISNHNEHSGSMRVVLRLFYAFAEAKTFSIVIAMLAIFCFLPTVIGGALENSCSDSCRQVWYVVVQYELYGINSIVNAFIYGIRHIKYRKAYGQILFKIIDCNCCG